MVESREQRIIGFHEGDKVMEKFKDRMGIYIGKIRIYEELTLEQLAAGLCSVGMLSRIERGEVEAGILLANTLLQRLGKSGDQFEWLLDKQEAESRLVRERIQVCLSEGKLEEAEILLRAYREDREKVLDVQYADIMELDLLWFRNEAVWKEKGVPPEITEKVLTVLRMTQPTYGKQPLSELLLSRAEGSLVYTYLTLLEQQKGRKATAAAWKEFLNYFMAERYVSKERVYFQPAVMLRLAEGEMEQGNPMAAYALCTEAIEELTQENRLFCYEELLELKGKAQVVLGIQDGTAGKLAEYLRTLRTKYTKGKKLWIPYEEAGNVYTVNEVIRSRRYLLGLSQEEVAGDICEPSTLWRIENGSKRCRKISESSCFRR